MTPATLTPRHPLRTVTSAQPSSRWPLRRTDRETWKNSKQLAAFGPDVVAFEGLRAVPSILLFLTLQEDQGNGGQHQRDAGGGRYKRLMDSIGRRRT